MYYSFMAEAKKIVRAVLKTIGYNVIDYTNDNELYPLIKFGYCHESNYPNKTHKAKMVFLTIDVWSDKRGSIEVMDISHSISSLLENYNNDNTDSKYKIVSTSISGVDVLEEEFKLNKSNKNVRLFHGIIPIQILMMEVC